MLEEAEAEEAEEGGGGCGGGGGGGGGGGEGGGGGVGGGSGGGGTVSRLVGSARGSYMLVRHCHLEDKYETHHHAGCASFQQHGTRPAVLHVIRANYAC